MGNARGAWPIVGSPSANRPIAEVQESCCDPRMRKPTPGESTLIIGAIAAALLWLLGETTMAIVILVAEAVGWAAIHAFKPSKDK